MQLSAPLPHGKFSYAIISGNRVNSLRELEAIQNPGKQKYIRKQVFISKSNRKILTERVVDMAKGGKSRKEIIDSIFATDLIKDSEGFEMTKKSLSCTVYRILKSHGLSRSRCGRPAKKVN